MFFSYNEELARSEHRVAHEHPWCGCPDSEEERYDVECWISELERGMDNVCVCVSMCPCWCKTKLIKNNRRGRKKEGGEYIHLSPPDSLSLSLCLFLPASVPLSQSKSNSLSLFPPLCLFLRFIPYYPLSLSLSDYIELSLSLSSSPSLSSLHPLFPSIPLCPSLSERSVT